MRSQTHARRKVYAVAITGAALLTLLLVDALGKAGTQLDSGQSRELINQPSCWTPENPDDISRCELDD